MPRSSITASQLAAPEPSPGGVSLEVVDAGLPQDFPDTHLIMLDTLTLAVFGFVDLALFKLRRRRS